MVALVMGMALAPADARAGGFTLPSGPYVLQSGTDIYAQNDFSYVDLSSDYGFSAFDYSSPKPDPNFGLGSTDGHFPVGFNASVYANASAGFNGSVSASNTLSYQWTQHVDTLVAGADGVGTATVGSTFTIGSNSSFTQHSLATNAGVFQATNDAYANLGAGAHLVGCVVICDSTDLGVGTGPNGITAHLLDYNSVANTATILGNTTVGALPQTYASPDNIFSATLSAPDLSGASQSGGANLAALYSSHPLGAGAVDVAAAVGEALGLPPEVFKDSILGFNYETVGAYIGAAINLAQVVVMKPLVLDHLYHFSSPVEVWNDVSQTWGSAVSSLSLLPDQFVQVRAPGALNLGITVENRASFKTFTTLELEAVLYAQLVLFHIDGHGLDQSLLNAVYNFAQTGVFGVDDERNTPLASVYEPPINLSFSQELAIGPCTFSCPEQTGYVTLIRIEPGSGSPADQISDNTIFRVLNFGAAGCNATTSVACLIDSSAPPKFFRSRMVMRDGQLVQEVSNDFATADAVVAAGDTGPRDTAAETVALQTLLAATYPGGRAPNIDVSAGVPEPAAWTEMLLGFGLLGALARRRRVTAR